MLVHTWTGTERVDDGKVPLAVMCFPLTRPVVNFSQFVSGIMHTLHVIVSAPLNILSAFYCRSSIYWSLKFMYLQQLGLRLCSLVAKTWNSQISTYKIEHRLASTDKHQWLWRMRFFCKTVASQTALYHISMRIIYNVRLKDVQHHLHDNVLTCCHCTPHTWPTFSKT